MEKNSVPYKCAIDSILPDSEIFSEVRKILDSDDEKIEIGRRRIAVPENVELEIVWKSVCVYNFPIGFGDHFSVRVAVGGVSSVTNGDLVPGLCFADMYFNLDCEPITVDFCL